MSGIEGAVIRVNVERGFGFITAANMADVFFHASDMDADLPFDDWLGLGDQLRASLQGHQWWIGDWLRFGGHKWGDKYKAAAEQLGMKPSSLKVLKSVSESYPESLMRINDLSFTHHQIAASLPPVERDLKLSEAAGAILPHRSGGRV